MNDIDDEAVDKILRDAFEGPVPDDGFCDSVMQVLPARRRRAAWPLVLGVVTGGAACGVSVLSTPLFQIGWHDWLSGQVSAPALAVLVTMTGISYLALAWTAAETDDR